MNPLCPQCQAELPDDFGLVDCKSCGAVCAIDLNDQVTVQGEEPVETPAESSETELYAAEESLSEESVPEDPVQEGVVDEMETYEAEAEESEPTEELLDEEPAVEESLEEEVATEESSEEEAFVTAEESEGSEVPQEEASTLDLEGSSLMGVDFLKELEVFSEESVADSGHVYYDFHVKDLDSADIRELFIETLADSRLEISEDSLRRLLEGKEEVTIPQMSFLRLAVAYKRLMSLGCEMSWSLSEVQEQSTHIFDGLSDETEEVSYEDEGSDYADFEEDY